MHYSREHLTSIDCNGIICVLYNKIIRMAPDIIYERHFPIPIIDFKENQLDVKIPVTYNINNYYRKELDGFLIAIDDLDKLKSYPLDRPRELILHINDVLGKRLFKWYKEKKLL